MDNGILVPIFSLNGVFKMSEATQNKRIILASASPRRREILTSMGVDFTVVCADADETSDIIEPSELTQELARRKGQAVYEFLCAQNKADGAVIISADTVVACDGEILGKPKDKADAERMLRMLSGKTHTVATGVAVTLDGETFTDCSVTHVRVDTIPDSEIEEYIATGEPFDKAGAYGIQGVFSKWIRGIDGCYFGVVGLPVNCLSRLFHSVVGCFPDKL